MEIQLKLYGSSKILSDKETLGVELPDNLNIENEADDILDFTERNPFGIP